MNGIQLYNGNPQWQPGVTPFGFYDEDKQFQTDAVKVARFCGYRLGYPILDVELQDKSMFACFEEAVTTYGNTVFSWKTRENYLSLEGGSKDIDANNMVLEPSLQRIVEIAKNYGTEADVGGNITLHKGLLPVKAGVQCYDLTEWAKNQGIVGGIEIRRVYYEAPPAILRYFDPYAGTGTGIQSLMDAFDFGSYSPGVNFLLMPVSADLLKIQAIEFNDQVRRSAYSFRVSNNQLELFPIPTQDGQLRIEYYKLSDKRKLNTGASVYESMSTYKQDYSVTVFAGRQTVTKVFDHNLGTEDITTHVYEKESDGSYKKIIPASIDIIDENSISVTFAASSTGVVILEYPDVVVDAENNTKGHRMSFTNITSNTFTHNLGTTDITIQAYTEDNTMLIPAEIKILNKNQVQVEFTEATSGYIILGYSGNNAEDDGSNVITNVSEVPFENPTYSKINSVGRQWIFKYTLALCKEVLAYVRGKYTQLPVPGSETTLNQSDLLTDARSEKENLIKELNEMLDMTSRKSQLERKSQETEFLKGVLVGVPTMVYIG